MKKVNIQNLQSSFFSTRAFLKNNLRAFIRLGVYDRPPYDGKGGWIPGWREQYFINANLDIATKKEYSDEYNRIIFSDCIKKTEYETTAEGFDNVLIRFVADRYAHQGYNYEDALWALSHMYKVPVNWTLPKKEINVRHNIEVKYKKMLERKHFCEDVKQFLRDHPNFQNYHETTFESHTGEHGYTDYDLVKMVATGFRVYCNSSHAWGGTCQCIDHDPGSNFTRPLDEYDFERLQFFANAQ